MLTKSEIYKYTYQNSLTQKYPFIIYFKDEKNRKNQEVLRIMVKIRSKYPKVPCRSFHWHLRKIDGINILAETSNYILCFQNGLQICAANAFNQMEVENLFMTVFNDLLENHRNEFIKILKRRKLLTNGEYLIKYEIEHPSYDKLNKDVLPSPSSTLTLENTSRSIYSPRRLEHNIVQNVAQCQVNNHFIHQRNDEIDLETQNNEFSQTLQNIKPVAYLPFRTSSLNPQNHLNHNRSTMEFQYPNTSHQSHGSFFISHSNSPNSLSPISFLNPRTYRHLPWQNVRLSNIPREFNNYNSRFMQSTYNNYYSPLILAHRTSVLIRPSQEIIGSQPNSNPQTIPHYNGEIANQVYYIQNIHP